MRTGPVWSTVTIACCLGTLLQAGDSHAQTPAAFVTVSGDSAEFVYPDVARDDPGCSMDHGAGRHRYSWHAAPKGSRSKRGKALAVSLDSVRLAEMTRPAILLPTRAEVGYVWGEPPNIWETIDDAVFAIRHEESRVVITMRGDSALSAFFESVPDSVWLAWCARRTFDWTFGRLFAASRRPLHDTSALRPQPPLAHFNPYNSRHRRRAASRTPFEARHRRPAPRPGSTSRTATHATRYPTS